MANPGGEEPFESDESLLEHIRRGDIARFSVLVQRYNRSLYRVARAIIRDEHEAEDIVQQTHVAAFMHLHKFEGRAKFSTWLARIAAHEALLRLRRQRRSTEFASEPTNGIAAALPIDTPEDTASRREIARRLEAEIDRLPYLYRTAFVLRHVEGLDTSEAAAWLGVSEANLRVMLHRACQMLRERITEQVQQSPEELFSFGGERCARVTRRVMLLIAPPSPAVVLGAVQGTRV